MSDVTAELILARGTLVWHLQLRAVSVFDDGAHYRILNFPVMKVHADFVADLELALWILGWTHNSVSIVSHGAAMPFFAFNLVGKPSAPFRGIHGALLEAPDSTAKPCLAQVKTCR